MTTKVDEDRVHMQRALRLAESGRLAVSPNPMVGAVIVQDGVVVGEGYHASYGGPHAEVEAIGDCRERGNDPAGATMYVTLEPCAHHGKTPPCVDAIIGARIARVVIGADDPSGHADGRGPQALRDAGVEAEFIGGAEAAAASLLTQPFRKRARTGRPLVTLKSAMTLDGRTATAAGDSQWITGAEARREVHRMRAASDAVAVGLGTVLADDPTLTAREVRVHRQPARVVFDSEAQLPLHCKLVRTIEQARLIVVTGEGADRGRTDNLTAAGVEVVRSAGHGADQIKPALAELGTLGISSLLLEGGARLNGSFFDAGEIDELAVFMAPVVIGGSGSNPVIGGAGSESMQAALRPLGVEWERWGNDMLARARLREW